MTDTVSASRPPTTRMQWFLWLALTAASLGGIVAIISLGPPFFHAQVPYTWYPWVIPLRWQLMPLVGILALASPLLTFVALIFRFWRRAALTLIGVCAVLQFAYFGLETYWKALERAGAFAEDNKGLFDDLLERKR